MAKGSDGFFHQDILNLQAALRGDFEAHPLDHQSTGLKFSYQRTQPGEIRAFQ